MPPHASHWPDSWPLRGPPVGSISRRSSRPSRPPITRGLPARSRPIARPTSWQHFPEVKQPFPAADYAGATGTLIFDIGGNKYRLIARADFEEQTLYIQAIMTHEKYNRENL